ncbi:MAG: tetratricopeptide repeat protein [Desulfomonile tiedjei]|nr:tetratricopeptide repeat protein [Desulfomonile tiedjei]
MNGNRVPKECATVFMRSSIKDKPASSPRWASVITPLSILLVLLTFFALSVGLHYAGFHARMIYDSVGLILENAHLFARNDPVAVMGIVPARPLFMLSLELNYLLAGMDPYWFRMGNSAILALAGLALTLLALAMFETPALAVPGTARAKRCVAFMLGLLFVVHPVQGFVVLYIWQREAIMACFFYLAALAAYLAVRTGRFRHDILGYTFTGTLFFAALMSKENAVTFPLTLVLAELTLLRRNLGETLKRLPAIVAIALPAISVQLYLNHNLHGPDAAFAQGILERLHDYYKESGLTPADVLLTQCRILFSYLVMILAPSLSGMQLVMPQIVSRSLLNPPITLAAAAGVVALIATGIALIRRQPLPAFGMLFFFLSLVPESAFIPQYLYCGYRAVLPMAGVLLIVGWVTLEALSRSPRPARTFAVVAVLLVGAGFLGTLTFQRSQRWDPVLLWKDAFEHLPTFTGDVEITPYMDVLGSYGQELSNSGNYQKAVEVLSAAADIDAQSQKYKKTLALVKLGLAQINKGDLADGIGTLRYAVKLNPGDSWARYQLGAALVGQGEKEEGMQRLREAVKLNPKDFAARSLLANCLRDSGALDEAIEHYHAAVRLEPRSAWIRNSLAATLERSGKPQLALGFYLQAVELAPESPELHFNLAKLLAAEGHPQEAVKHYQSAIRLNPGFVGATANLGTLLLKTGRMHEALTTLTKAVQMFPNNAELHYQAGLVLAALGETVEAVGEFEKALALKPDHRGAGEQLRNIATGKSRGELKGSDIPASGTDSATMVPERATTQ